MRDIEIIGEAVKNLPQPLRDGYPDIPWRKIGRTRDILAHVYFGIDKDAIWQIVSVEAARLRARVAEMLEALPEELEGDITP